MLYIFIVIIALSIYIIIVVLLLCLDQYPTRTPDISISHQLNGLGLDRHIRSAIRDMAGMPVLFDILTATKEWIEGHPHSVSSTPPIATPTQSPSKSTKPVCRFFAKGTCKFGSKCKNYHPGSAQSRDHHGDSVEQPSTTSDLQNTVSHQNGSPEKNVLSDAASKKGSSEKSILPEKDAAKKHSMRTAADVIKRIQWDIDLPTEKFCVGYLDRFVGIIEKPFTAFTWEDLATLAPNVLAVPEHRIQYFKYLDEIVWDKTKQLDNVFGSRGGKLIQDVIQAHSEAHSDSVTETSTSTDAANSDTIHYKNTQERPTHFICFRIRDESITAQAEKVQNHILEGIPDLSEGCVLVTALHVTVCMVQLKTQQHIDIAKGVMEKTKEYLSQYVPKGTEIVVNRVDNFQDRLVYAKVEPNKALDRLSYLLIERLQDAGLKTPGNYDVYTPHMTLVKMSRPLQRTIDTKVIRRELYAGFSNTYFGKQKIEGLCLCSMREPKQEDGFFLRLHDVSNSVLHLSPAIPSLFSKMMSILKASGIEVSRELELRPEDVLKFDHSVNAVGQLVKENLRNDRFKKNSLKTRVVILRGLPGSGKSYLATHCCGPDGIVCSSDSYFSTSKPEGYQFDRKRLPEAHAHCCKQFIQAIADGHGLVIVDNTNSMKWEYKVYVHLSQMLGLEYSIVEIPHPNLNIVSCYLSRNVHGLTLAAVKDYTDRWEEDEDSVLVPPALAYPKSSDVHPANRLPLPLSILDICSTQSGKLPERVVESSASLELLFTGIFLTPAAEWELVSAVAPTHPVVYAEHATLIYKPNFEALKTLKMGKKVFVTVWGVGDNGEVQAVEVDMPNGISCSNEHPHITISTVPSSAPKYSNTMLASHPARQLQNPLVLEGTVGVAVKEASDDDATEYFPILSKENFVNQVAPRLLNLSFKDSATPPKLDESVSIATGTQPVTELLIFDFDGTLFDSPYPEPGKLAYKAATGQEWPHKGWWGKAESLLPPVVVGPGPVLETYRTHHNSASSATIILTARKKKTESGVRHVLDMYNVRPDVIVFKPDDWPSTQDNSVFKVTYLKRLLEKFPQVKRVRLWDDNEDNVAAFKQFAESNNTGIHFEIIDASGMNSASDMLSSSTELLPFLSRCGELASSEYYSAAAIGIDFIAQQFGKLIGFDENPAVLVRVFGSYCFGRQSDVDMLVMAPPTFTPVECMERMFDRLAECGIVHLHKGYSSRCPRLKVKMSFFSHSTIEYDIIFAMVDSEESLKLCTESSSTQSLEKLLKRDDQVSKRAFFGLIFLQKVKDIIRGVVSSTNFGAVIEMVVQILKANRLKGNCYRCIHTFHIVQLLADFIKTHKKRTAHIEELSADTLFREFISHSALLPASKWEKLCGEFAAKEHLPRLIQVFQKISKIIQSQEGDSGILNYEHLLVPSAFPPEGFTPVRIVCRSTDKQLQWEMENALEARLPTYISQLFANGLIVIPESHSVTEGATFAVNKSDSSASVVQETFRKFWAEFSDYRKRDGVHMELKLEDVGDVTLDTDDRTVREVMEFASSQQQDCHLPASLSANERRIAHETAEKLKIGHKTEGDGKNRHVHLFKTNT